MSESWNSISVRLGDAVLGWLLLLPRDLALLLLALCTVGCLLLLRRCLAQQALLKAVNGDLRQLRELLHAARSANDEPAIARYRVTRTRLLRLRFLKELTPALVSLVPLAMVVTWGNARLAYLPPAVNETVDLTLFAPIADVGKIVHLVPQSGVTARDGWIKTLAEENKTAQRSHATWSLSSTAPQSIQMLKIRYGNETVTHPFQIGERMDSIVTMKHGDQLETHLNLRAYQPLSIVPAIPLLGIHGWLSGYLLLAVFLFLLGRRLLKIF